MTCFSNLVIFLLQSYAGLLKIGINHMAPIEVITKSFNKLVSIGLTVEYI